MKQRPAGKSKRENARAGLALLAVGAALLSLMLAFPERLNVPPMVGYAAAGAFVAGGVLALANAFGGPVARAWSAVALLVLLAIPGMWIAVGPGERLCSAEVAWLFGVARGGSCRVAFGIASLVVLAMVFVAVHHAVRIRKNPRA